MARRRQIVLPSIYDKHALTLATFAVATLAMLASHFFDSQAAFWLGVAVNCAGIGLLYEE